MFKKDFPIFKKTDMVYLDTAASAQKPAAVLRAMDRFYKTAYSNVHRGQCAWAAAATKAYEAARQNVADFIHADAANIVFTRGATDAVNLVAAGMAQTLKPGDEVLISIAEHHANFVPWQQACLKSGATFQVANILPSGELDRADFARKLTPRTKVVAITHLSNVLGVLNDAAALTRSAHAVGARILIDAAQSIAHVPLDVREIGCDFLVFSGHKLYGPTGVGVLYGPADALANLPPYQFGGDMIRQVAVSETTFADAPAKFEAGTPMIAEAVGLGAAVGYLNRIGWDKIRRHEEELMEYALAELAKIPEVRLMGTAEKQSVIAFTLDGIAAEDIGFVLGKKNICVRVGHHCAMPLHAHFGRAASARISFGLYNDAADIDRFIAALREGMRFFK
ncbi:MAG: cysteine desulfurase [Alphaproteobacteria bacterium]|nr:cysteine desulfurase [Alphaproteobacteria bacterium]